MSNRVIKAPKGKEAESHDANKSFRDWPLLCLIRCVRPKAFAPALERAAEPQRAKHFFELLLATEAGPRLGKLPDEHIRVVVALFSGSQALGNLLVANPQWLDLLGIDRLRHPRRAQGLRHEIEGWLKPLLAGRDYGEALTRLRRFRQVEMLRIAARDLARMGNTAEIVREISDVADACLDAVW